jgi:hypothetical protein
LKECKFLTCIGYGANKKVAGPFFELSEKLKYKKDTDFGH